MTATYERPYGWSHHTWRIRSRYQPGRARWWTLAVHCSLPSLGVWRKPGEQARTLVLLPAVRVTFTRYDREET